ncbi:hypothetical protein CR205_09365 [Alteribacter lacisalsi]|uniref:Uncharacterized protein n=1 Tax=Alteribacter lacisalsi TaxID=2045244 RepID=A0A2W0HNV1_9BACI|nr:hypothetical protein CR205_09365 [Alteribacter lacisalsi]
MEKPPWWALYLYVYARYRFRVRVHREFDRKRRKNTTDVSGHVSWDGSSIAFHLSNDGKPKRLHSMQPSCSMKEM